MPPPRWQFCWLSDSCWLCGLGRADAHPRRSNVVGAAVIEDGLLDAADFCARADAARARSKATASVGRMRAMGVVRGDAREGGRRCGPAGAGAGSYRGQLVPRGWRVLGAHGAGLRAQLRRD